MVRGFAVLPLVLIVTATGCSTSGGGGAPDGGDDAPVDGDGGAPCLFCTDGGPNVDASLGQRAYTRLIGCDSLDGCHVTSAGGLTFPPANPPHFAIDAASSERPSMLRIKPYDPWNSYLFLKVYGDGGIDGTCMPQGTCPDPAVQSLFYDWIEAGCQPP